MVISNEDLANPSNNLVQTAAQIWLLSRVVAFFGEPFADEFPDVWKVLQTVLEVTAICWLCKEHFCEHHWLFKMPSQRTSSNI